MARTPGNLEEKRKEIILKSQELFFANGIEKTSISSITKSLNISKGLFYYYFDSKDSLIKAVTDSILDTAKTKIISIINDDSFTFKEKIQKSFYSLCNTFENIPKEIGSYCHSDGFIEIHNKLADEFIDSLLPHLMVAVDIAIERKEFNIPYPHETLKIFIYGLVKTLHSEENINSILDDHNTMLEKTFIILDYYFS